MKYLLWALLIYLAWRWYETKKAKEADAEANAAQPAASTSSAAPASAGRAEKMVACARCGIHLPQSEALQVAELHYCDEHRPGQSST